MNLSPIGEKMKFKVESLRLEKSHWGGYYIGIDFDQRTSTGIKISKKRYLELKALIEKEFSNLVIE